MQPRPPLPPAKPESPSHYPPSVFTNPIHFFAFGLGSGTAKYAPGTCGTLAAIPLYIVVSGLPVWLYSVHTVILLLVGIWLCHVTARDIGVEDHPGIVWDEIVGYLITMSAAPPGWQWMVIGFLLFRLFDIWKPWPIYLLDRHVKGGLGIMLDDVLAGVFAFAVLQGLARLPFWG